MEIGPTSAALWRGFDTTKPNPTEQDWRELSRRFALWVALLEWQAPYVRPEILTFLLARFADGDDGPGALEIYARMNHESYTALFEGDGLDDEWAFEIAVTLAMYWQSKDQVGESWDWVMMKMAVDGFLGNWRHMPSYVRLSIGPAERE